MADQIVDTNSKEFKDSWSEFYNNHKKKNKSWRETEAALSQLWQQHLQKYIQERTKETTDVELTPEQVVQKTEEFAKTYQESQGATAVTTSQTFVPQRKVALTQENIAAGASQAVSTARRVEGGSSVAYYSGDMLVNRDGIITRGPYSDNDAELVLREVSLQGNTKLNEFLNTLSSHGYYQGNKPSNLAKSGQGFANDDFSAVSMFLEQANRKGLTWDAYLPAVEASAGTYSGGGGGGSYSSKEDIAVYLRSAGFKYLGRPMTKEEIDAAARRIQQEQLSRTSSSGGEETTALSTSAMLEAQKAAPEEYAAYSLGAALDRIYAKLGAQ